MQKLEAEVERICNPGFFKDLAPIATEILRARKEDAEAIEEMVSYARRIIQGRLDTFEFDPDELGLSMDQTDVEGINRLQNAIVSGTSPSSENFGKFVDSSMSGSAIEEVESELADLLQTARTEAYVGSPADSPEAELRALRSVEATVSGWRKKLFFAIDALRAELVVRYRDDSSMVDDLLAKVLKRDNEG